MKEKIKSNIPRLFLFIFILFSYIYLSMDNSSLYLRNLEIANKLNKEMYKTESKTEEQRKKIIDEYMSKLEIEDVSVESYEFKKNKKNISVLSIKTRNDGGSFCNEYEIMNLLTYTKCKEEVIQ